MEPTQNSNFENNLEAEIAQLSKEIEEKRKILAEQSGVVEEGSGSEKEIVRDVLRERIFSDDGVTTGAASDATTDQTAVSTPAPASKAGHDYLENLDSLTIVRINELVSEVAHSGLEATIKRAKNESPHILDAFHDLLVNRLYDDLKQRGLVK